MDLQRARDVLEVSADPSDGELRRALRLKRKAFHPDLNKAPDAVERFKEVGEAFAVLQAELKRREQPDPVEPPNRGPVATDGFFSGFADKLDPKVLQVLQAIRRAAVDMHREAERRRLQEELEELDEEAELQARLKAQQETRKRRAAFDRMRRAGARLRDAKLQEKPLSWDPETPESSDPVQDGLRQVRGLGRR